MKKILIRENTTEANKRISDFEKFVSDIQNQVIPAFESLSIGKLNSELLIDCFTNDCFEVNRLIALQAEQDTATITTPAIITEIFNVVYAIKLSFNQVCKGLSTVENLGLVKYVQFEAGEIVNVVEAKAAIVEDAKYYIHDERLIAIYNEIKLCAESHNRLLNMLGENSQMILKNNGLSFYFEYNKDTFRAEPSKSINYEFALT
jgi:hypothetical protein